VPLRQERLSIWLPLSLRSSRGEGGAFGGKFAREDYGELRACKREQQMYLKVVRLQLDSGRVFFSSNATSKPTSSIVLEGGSCSRGEERNSLVVEGRHGSTSTRIIFPTTAVLEGWETALTLHQSGVIRQINRAEDVWRIADKLGEGAFSSVYRATAQEGEKVVALKILPKRLLPSSSDRLRVFREIEVMSPLLMTCLYFA